MRQTCLILFFVINNFGTKAQPNSLFDRFYASFIDNYKELISVSNLNYYQVLSYSGKLSFTFQNPAFVAAVADFQNTAKVSEIVAIDSLFQQIFRKFRSKDIWIFYPNEVRNGTNLLNLYNSHICDCMSSKLSKNDPAEKFLDIQKACISDIAIDTNFHKQLRAVGGNFTLNDLARYQGPLLAKIYSECPIVTHQMDLGIRYSIVEESYRSDINIKKRNDIDTLVQNYKLGKLDVVKQMFPSFRKYKKELDTLVNSINLADTKPRTYYSDYLLTTTIQIADKSGNEILGKFEMLNENFNAKIVSLKLEKKRFDEFDQILEIREAPLIPEPD